MAKEIEVEVHCWGPQNLDDGNLHVRGAEPWEEIANGTPGKFKNALEALSLNLTQVKALTGIDIVHTHTWYASMAGFLGKMLYNVPFVLTTHSLEPLRAWKADQLGTGYAMSSWMERTAILDAQGEELARGIGHDDDIALDGWARRAKQSRGLGNAVLGPEAMPVIGGKRLQLVLDRDGEVLTVPPLSEALRRLDHHWDHVHHDQNAAGAAQ